MHGHCRTAIRIIERTPIVLYRVNVRFVSPRMSQNGDCGRFMQTAWHTLLKCLLILDKRWDVRHDEGYTGQAIRACRSGHVTLTWTRVYYCASHV